MIILSTLGFYVGCLGLLLSNKQPHSLYTLKTNSSTSVLQTSHIMLPILTHSPSSYSVSNTVTLSTTYKEYGPLGGFGLRISVNVVANIIIQNIKKHQDEWIYCCKCICNDFSNCCQPIATRFADDLSIRISKNRSSLRLQRMSY